MHDEGQMIHDSAIIHPTADIGRGVTIGPFCVIGQNVSIGTGTIIGSHVVISRNTKIGDRNQIFHHAVLGESPQDKKFKGEKTFLEIGDDNVIREFCTFNLGTHQDAGVTKVGDRNWIMAYVHIAHDCEVGNDVVLANCVQLAGHVFVGNHSILGGFTGVHQFCRIGDHAFCGVGSVVVSDVPPFVMCMGNTVRPHGINVEGLKRRGFTSADIADIKKAYKTLYRSSNTLPDAVASLELQESGNPKLGLLVDFLKTRSGRGIIR